MEMKSMKKTISGIIILSVMICLGPMPAMGAPANIQQVVKSQEEEQEIVDFLKQYIYIGYSGYDVNNPDPYLLADFMTYLLIRHPETLPYEYLWSEEDYDANWVYGEADKKYKEADVNRKYMELFGIDFDFQKYRVGYDVANREAGYVYIGEPGDPEELLTIDIKSMYTSGDGLIYMDIVERGTWEWEKEQIVKKNLYRYLPASLQESFYYKAPRKVVIKEIMKDGQKSYQLMKYMDYQGPSIFVNNKMLEASGVSKDNRVLVPLRAIFEALGAQVNYDSKNKKITGILGDRVVHLTLNKKEALVGNKQVILDVPAQVVDSSTLVPVRFIGESLGAEVVWENNTVIINSN